MKLIKAWQLGEAWKRYCEAMNIDRTSAAGRQSFMVYLHGNPPLPVHQVSTTWWPHDLWEVSDEAFEQIERIRNSPYYKTLIKAHYARK